jgi:PAS domain S-box-containing protein
VSDAVAGVERSVNPRVRFALELVAVGGLFAAARIVTLYLSEHGARIPLSWLPTGLAVASLMRFGSRLWPAILVASLLSSAYAHTPALAAGAVAAGATLGALVTAKSLERLGFHHDFDRRADVVMFCVVVAAAMILPALCGVAGYVAVGRTALAAAPGSYLRWWLNCVASALLIAPPLLAARTETWRELRRRPLAALLWLAGVVAVAVAFLSPPASALAMPLMFGAVLLIVWGALKFGVGATSTATLVVSAVAAWSVAYGVGAFAVFPLIEGQRLLWAYASTLAAVGLLSTALLAEHDRALRELEHSDQRYRLLFETSPQPVLVYDPENLRILMANEASTRRLGYSREELLGMTVEALQPAGELATWRDATPGAGAEPGLARLKARDGRMVETEITTQPLELEGRRAELVFAVDVSERNRLQRAVLDANQREQRRLGQEMHDGLGQELTGLAMLTRSVATRAARERAQNSAELARLAEIAAKTIRTCRNIAHGLSPLSGARGGLVEALRELSEAGGSGSGPAVRFVAREAAPLSLPEEARNHLYRIAQEALTNALKHARGKSIEIVLDVQAEVVRLLIVDDGKGIPAARPAGAGLGLESIRYRAASLGARLWIGPGEQGGTAIICECMQSAARPAAAG